MDAEIGIIGGSGFYEFLDNPDEVELDTPYGTPSAPLALGDVAGRRVAFVPRHGRRHEFPPHQVNFRANLWALRSAGVRQVLAPAAVGSLRPELDPGTFVVPDQVLDRTWGRAHSVYDRPGRVVHIGFADPYCPRGRAAILASADPEVRLVDGGTLVVINGPRFSTRAESVWHQAAGAAVVGMTGMPEASIARELALCYSTVCLVTDHDAGVDGGVAVTHAEVLAQFAANIERMKALLARAVAALPGHEQDDSTAVCSCRHALDGQELPFVLP